MRRREQAMGLIEKLRQTSEVIRFSAAISACEALTPSNKMSQTGMTADAISICTAISAYEKDRQSKTIVAHPHH